MKNRIATLLFQSVLLTAFALNIYSQAGTPLIKVIVSPDHKDWTYKVNETAKFSVQVLKYGNLLENVTVDYEAGPEMLPDIKKEGVVSEKRQNGAFRNNESPGILSFKGMGSC